MNREIQLGKRLGEIAKFITLAKQPDQYDHIWDCCCDHGYLGTYLLDHFSQQNHHKAQINFVDQVTHITDQLCSKLKKSPFSAYQVHTLNTEHLEFDKHQRHCIIIAGVTTTGTLKILQTILNKHPTQELDFILCPTRGQYDLRQYLIRQKVHLLEEAYIQENGRHYELLYVRQQTRHNQEEYKQISSIGEFWKANNEDHLAYIKNRIEHFQQEAIDTSRVDSVQAVRLYANMYQELSPDKKEM
tara:strand:+ start:9940 stop:10671 length:732 start_codon:yes stop_codon:yes gene_type:complete